MLKYFFPLILLFAGCSERKSSLNEWMGDDARVRVLCTTAMINDLVVQVGGDRVCSSVLIRGEMDPHSYELVKGDGEKIDRAECLFANGLGLEHGSSMQRVFSMDKTVALGDTLENLLKVEGSIDPHIWMDVALFAQVVDPIVKKLSETQPEYAQEFEERGRVCKQELLALDAEICEILAAVPDHRKYLVTSHDAFNYFARRYLGDDWSKRFQAPEGLAPDGQLSTNDIQRILDHLERYDVNTLFPESNVSRDSLKKIVDAGRRCQREVIIVEEPLFGDTMGPSYVEMMRHNALTIATHLSDR